MPMVIDASITMAWCFADERTPFTQGVLALLTQVEAIVPSLWPLEVSNILLVGERRGRLTVAETESFIQHLEALPITVEPDDRGAQAMGRILSIGRKHQLSAYDATYLDLALRGGYRLATLDAALRAAAAASGVAVVE